MGEAFITRRGGGGTDFTKCVFSTGQLGGSVGGIYFLKTNQAGNQYYDPMDFSYVIMTRQSDHNYLCDMVILKVNKAEKSFENIEVGRPVGGTTGSDKSLTDLTFVYKPPRFYGPTIDANLSGSGGMDVMAMLIP